MSHRQPGTGIAAGAGESPGPFGWGGQPKHKNFKPLERSVPSPWEPSSPNPARRVPPAPPGPTPAYLHPSLKAGRRAPAAVPGKSRPDPASRGFPEPAPPGGDRGRAGQGSPRRDGHLPAAASWPHRLSATRLMAVLRGVGSTLHHPIPKASRSSSGEGPSASPTADFHFYYCKFTVVFIYTF